MLSIPDKRFEILSDFEVPPHILAQLPQTLAPLLTMTLTQYRTNVLNDKQVNFTYPLLYHMATEKYIFAFGMHMDENCNNILSLIEAKTFIQKRSNFYVQLHPVQPIQSCPLNIVWKLIIKLCLSPEIFCGVCSSSTFTINQFRYCMSIDCSHSVIHLGADHLCFGDEVLINAHELDTKRGEKKFNEYKNTIQEYKHLNRKHDASGPSVSR